MAHPRACLRTRPGADHFGVVEQRAIEKNKIGPVQARPQFGSYDAGGRRELFSPGIIKERVAGMLAHYDFVTHETLAYFESRPPQARRDANFALSYVQRHATTTETQSAVLAALTFKCSVLWAMLDAMQLADGIGDRKDRA